MTYDFRKSKDEVLLKGEWTETYTTVKSAIICCPKCGLFGDLREHTIKDDGIVEPSVLHIYPIADADGSNPREGCGFHEMIRLLEWTP